jgi:uncharacterized protein (DUF1015 family)
MPELLPFRGLRPDPAVVGPLDDFVCPPYDVISDEERLELLRRSPYNFVRLELPGGDYVAAASSFEQWKAAGVFSRDESPALYGYRMSYKLPGGEARSTLGVIGALVLEPLGEGVLPHEETTPKAKTDRLDLIRAIKANTSPIWCLCSEPGLAEAVSQARSQAPDLTAVRDRDGNLHEIWGIFEPTRLEALAKVASSGPLLIADGHHRYETALAYHAEQQAKGMARRERADGDGAVMALVVELSEGGPSVLSIHRLVSGLPQGADPLGAFKAAFALSPAAANDEGLLDEMAAAAAVGVVTPAGSFLARPLPGGPSSSSELDSARVDAALSSLPPHQLSYEHDVEEAIRAVREGRADLAVFCRPARVDQIAAAGRGGKRMPPKTTLFWPKPLSGMVVRDW